MATNPYADVDLPGPYTSANPAYAVNANSWERQDSGGYVDHPASEWSPKLEAGPVSTPDDARLMRRKLRQFRPPANRPPEEWWDKNAEDENRRESVTSQDADGWTEQKSQLKRAPDPRWNAPPETRLTQQMSPANYAFTRPYAENYTGTARLFNGVHFSMADHRREYAILGMVPPMQHRNTYRLDPTPWDNDMMDVPTNAPGPVTLPGRIEAMNIPPVMGTRSYRTGG